MANEVTRAVTVMTQLKDGAVPAPTMKKYAQAFWVVYDAIQIPTDPETGEPTGPGDAVDVENPTNEELAIFYLKRLRLHHRKVLSSSRAPLMGETARQAEIAAVNAEVDNDLEE